MSPASINVTKYKELYDALHDLNYTSESLMKNVSKVLKNPLLTISYPKITLINKNILFW